MDIRVVDVEYNDDDGYDVHAYLKVSEDTTEEEVEDYLYDHGNIEVYVNGFDTLNVKNASKYKDYDFVTYVDEPDDSVFEGVARNFSDALIEDYIDHDAVEEAFTKMPYEPQIYDATGNLLDVVPEDIKAIWRKVVDYCNNNYIVMNNDAVKYDVIETVCTPEEMRALAEFTGADGKVYSCYPKDRLI